MRRIFTLFVSLFCISWLANGQTVTPSVTSLSALTATTYGTASATASFTFNAAAQGNGGIVTVTAPAGFEVSTGGAYGTTATATADGSGAINNQNVNVRLAAATVPGSYSGNITITPSTVAATVSIAASIVNPKALTITGATANNKVYDGGTTATVTASPTLNGIVGSDVVTINGGASGTFASANVGTSISVTSNYSLGGANASNYTVTQPTLSANITAAPLTVTGAVANDKVYDGGTTVALNNGGAALSGVVGGDAGYVNLNSGGASGTFASANVGTGITVTTSGYALAAGGSGDRSGNYSLTQPTLSANITAINLTISGVTASNKVYDATQAATLNTGAAALVGVLGGDAGYVALNSGSAAGTFASANVGSGITVTTSGFALAAGGSGDRTGNYTLTQPSLSANITAAPLTISGVTANNKIYDKTNTATLNNGSASLVGIIGGDNVTLNSGGASATFVSVNVASGITVTASGYVLGGTAAGNYSLTQPSGLTANITSKALTMTGITANNKVYDGTTTATLTGTAVLQTAEAAGAGSTSDGKPYSGDALTLNAGTAAFSTAATNQGQANVTVTTAGYNLTGGAAGNYSVTQSTLSANIDAAEPTTQATNIAFANVTATSMDISWTNGNGSNRLVLVHEAVAVNATPTDFNSYTANNDWNAGGTPLGAQIGTGNYVVYVGGSNSFSLTNLNANTQYNVQVFEFNGAPGSGLENYNVNNAGSNPKNQNTTNADVTSTFTGGTGPASVASTATTQPTEVVVFQFTANDGSATGAASPDNLTTRFSQLIFRPGTGNQVSDWTQLIQGAELYDNNASPLGGTASGAHGTALITANTITIPSIDYGGTGNASSTSNLGVITKNTSKTYFLKVWFYTSLGGSLPTTIDNNQNLAFSIKGSDVTPVAGRSQFTLATTTSSGSSNDQVTVTASKLLFVQQPTTTCQFGTMSPAVTVQATDANGNLDWDYVQTVAITSTGTLSSSPQNATFVQGLGTYSSIVHTSAGLYTLTATKAGVTSAVSNLFTISSASNTSDIIADPAFLYSSNIDYTLAANQVTSIASSTDGTAVGQFIIRDGGATFIDTDTNPTLLSAISFTVSNYTAIRELAIFDGTTNVAEITVSGPTATFSGLSLSAPDGGSKTFSLRASFTTIVTDHEQLQFTVSSATATPPPCTSLFAATNAGGATTTTCGCSPATTNAISVLATQIQFLQQPTSTLVNTPMSPIPTLKACDVNGNIDTDFNSAPAQLKVFSTTGGMTPSIVQAPFNSGIATLNYSGLISFFSASTNTQLGVNQAPVGPIPFYSNTFDIIANTSDIITNSSFVAPTGIQYVNYQESSDIVNSGTSLVVAKFDLRDGGFSSPDGDPLPTVLTDLTLQIPINFSYIRKIALYDATGTTELAATTNEQAVGSSTVVFSGLNISAPDNGVTSFTVRVSFNTTVTDNQTFYFNITSATAQTGNSQFASSNAGGAFSNSNSVNVIATKFDFTTNPLSSQLVLIGLTSTSASPDFSTVPVLRARDANANTDTDYTASITLASAAAPLSSTSLSMSNGYLAFPGTFQYTDSGNGQLTASSATTNALGGTLTNGTSGAVTVIYSNTSTITTASTYSQSALINPLSLYNSFDFAINEDNLSGGDGSPTRVTQLVFTPGTGNTVSDWTKAIKLSNTYIYDVTNGIVMYASSITATSITFTGINTATVGYIADNAKKEYVLVAAYNQPMTGVFDNQTLVFELLDTNVTLSAQSSLLLTGTKANSGSGFNKFNVVASKLVFTTDLPGTDILTNKDISAQITVPVIEAVDAVGNRDVDYTAAITSFTSAGATTFSNAPSTITAGIVTFPSNFRYTNIGNGTTTNGTLTVGTSVLPSGSLTPPTSAVSTATHVRAGLASTITNGTGSATISSITNNSPGTQVFAFDINDDPGGTPSTEDDGNATQLTGLKITNGTGDNIAGATYGWNNAIAGATLSDGTNTVTALPANITSTYIYFDLTSAPGPSLGLVGDGATKNFKLNIWLKNPLGGTLPANIDGLNFVFDVQAGNIFLSPNGTSFKASPYQTQNSGSGNGKVTVIATQLDITTPSTAANASISSDFPGGGANVVVQARDANANRDLDFTGKITSLTNATGATMINGPTIGTSAFGSPYPAGTYQFATNFQYTSGSNTDNVTLTIKADNTGGNSGTDCTPGTGNAICSGISPTITLQTSFESSLQLDPTFKPVIVPTIPNVGYISYLDSATFGASTNGYELIRAMVVDGSRTNYNYKNQYNQTGILDTQSDAEGNGNGDLDGAKSVLTNLKLRVFGAASLSRIALYDSTGTIVPNTLIDVTSLGLSRSPSNGPDTTSYVFTWPTSAGNLVTAKDNGQAPFSVRATFRKTSSRIRDQDIIQVRLIAATLGTGSQFYQKGVPGYNAGTNYNTTPQPVAKVDVVATSLDFTTQASNYAGINEPVGVSYTTSPLPSTSAAIVSARDKFTLIDLDFNYPATSISISDPAGEIIPSPAGFSNGVLNLDGLKYTITGNGTLKVVANGIDSSNPPGANLSAIPGSLVNVVNVAATYPTSGVIQGSGSPLSYSIKGGSQAQVIFGVTFTAQSATATDPKLSKFSFSFDIPYANSSRIIFSNFVVKEVSGAGTFDITSPTINGNLMFGSSTSDSNLDIVTVDLSAIPRSLFSEPTKSLTYYLIADVDATANISTPSITPKFDDGGYLSATDKNIVVSKGTASGQFNGNIYTFASTKPPVLKTAKTSLTNPYSGQLNVSALLDHIDLEFDTKVGTLDGGQNNGAELWSRTTNTKVADLIAPYNVNNTPVVPGNYLSTGDYKVVVNPLRYDIKFLNGASFQPNEVYYVLIKKGTFDPLAVPPSGTGISDQGLNFYGGISSNSTLYFKISSDQPLLLSKAKSTFYNKSVGTISTQFDQFGTAYYLIVQSGSPAPTNYSQVKTPSTYLGATIYASGSYTIDQVNTTQTATFPSTVPFVLGQNYDIYIYAENDANPTPVSAGGIYGSNLIANGGGATIQVAFSTTSSAQPFYLICPNSFVKVSDPIILGEPAVSTFSSGTLLSPTVQDFNILLPPGYQFDGVTLPDVQLIGADFNGTVATPSFVSNSVLNISYKNYGSVSTDYIVISNLTVIGATGSTSQAIQRFYGNNTSFSSPTASIATIGLFPSSTFAFDNSYSQSNWASNLFPLGSPNPVNAIPDNYVDIDPNINGSIRLVPNITVPNDYNASIFEGTGVANDLLTLSAVPNNSAFNITMNHTDPNGCVSQISQQYLVYDHTSPVSKKLGAVTNSITIPQGTAQALVNTAFPNQSPSIPSQQILHNELAGYELVSLTADLPASVITGQTSQIMNGPDWRWLISKIPNSPTSVAVPPLGTYNNYTWDYKHILNAVSEVVTNAGNQGTITIDPYYGDVTNRFDARTSNGNTYWKGGSLGQVEFTGLFRSTADLSVYIPFRQGVELFVPAVPLIEVASANQSSYDDADGTVNVNAQTAYNYIKNTFGFQYTNANGYQGTSVFCEAGGTITLNGYPAALGGTSTGSFAIYDFKSYDFSTNTGTVLLNPALNTAFVDNGNGSMTLDPTNASVKNFYNDILVRYTYQENNSPAVGIGFLVIRITPNPIAKFTISSVTGASNPSSTFNSFCLGNPIDFDAVGNGSNTSTIAQPTQAGSSNSITNYVWDFGDPNSGLANSSTTPQTPHTYNVSSTYPVTLTLTSNWGCSSLSVAAVITTQATNVLYAGSSGNIIVGEIPIPLFSMTNNCVKDAIHFKATASQMPSGGSSNSVIAKYNWVYDSLTQNTAVNRPSPATGSFTIDTTYTRYKQPGFYNVQLTTVTSLGCQSAIVKPISQLPVVSAFSNNFDANDGSWQPLDLSSNLPKPGVNNPNSSWIWGVTSNRTNTVFNSSASNKLWSTAAARTTSVGSYSPNEKSALYSGCLDLNPITVPRPMISYSSFVDVNTGDGLVLQYSIDNLNILDPNKTWANLGSTPTGPSPGLDWYNTLGLPSNPGNTGPTTPNSIGTGWTTLPTDPKKWIHPKHNLDAVANLAGSQKVILRFAFASVASSTTNLDGVAVDSVFFGSRTRTILFENFTSTDAGGNTALNSQIQSDNAAISAFVVNNINSTQLVDINYHVGFVGQDPFNIDNASDPGARALYYGVKQIPYAFLDGNHYQGNVSAPNNPDLFQFWGQAEYDLNTLQLAKADFNNVVTVNPDGSLKIDVSFKPLFDLPSGVGGTTLQVAVLEKVITGTSIPSYGKITTGETSFEYVLKKLLPSAVGTQFTNPIVAGTPISAGTFKYQPQNLHSNVLTVVVFLQNETTKEVYQADLIDNNTVNPLVTGVELLSAENIRLYPNPADRELTIELPAPAKESTTLRLANQLGQFIELDAFAEGERTKTISTHTLSEGVYILQIGGNNSAVRTKVVVVHK